MKDIYSKPTNRRTTFGKGNNQKVPEQLDLESSYTFEVDSDYACLQVSRETLRTIDSFLEQSRSIQSNYSIQTISATKDCPHGPTASRRCGVTQLITGAVKGVSSGRSTPNPATFIPTRTDEDARFSVRPWPWLRSYQHGRPRTDGKKMARTKKQKLMLWWWWRRRVNKVHSIRRFSVHPVNRSRHVHGEYHHLIPVLLDDPFKFAEYLRMNLHAPEKSDRFRFSAF